MSMNAERINFSYHHIKRAMVPHSCNYTTVAIGRTVEKGRQRAAACQKVPSTMYLSQTSQVARPHKRLQYVNAG
jgi:hypothetical protein